MHRFKNLLVVAGARGIDKALWNRIPRPVARNGAAVNRVRFSFPTMTPDGFASPATLEAGTA